MIRIDRSVASPPAPHGELTTALRAVFGDRCAYCESPVELMTARFRPRASAVNLDGTTDIPGYPWLADAWENIYLACQICDRVKSNRFPVAGPRARGPADDLAAERHMLLDPCADDPGLHLAFDVQGRVAGRTDRGAVTIDVLGLNRPGLVVSRRVAAEAALARGHVDERAGFVAGQRQVLAGDDGDERIFVWQEAHEEDLRRASVLEDRDLEARQSQRISRVEIENFRGIQQLAFDLAGGSGEQAGWTMLLGENGVGKSSVLHALAVALMGEERLALLGADGHPSELLRRGTSSGSIRVFFAADAEPLEVTLTPEAIEFSEAAKRPRMILLGFGSSRWLPRPGSLAPDRGESIRVANLFNPFVPLADTLAWLGGLEDAEFARAEQALLRLLGLDSGERLVRADGEILVHRPDSDTPVRHLSDGYQAVLAMVGDIMELLSPKQLDMSVAEGLVLVDELEAHLHPRWKLQVVSRLRHVFPGLQFIASTHDPLCLRGLHENEVLLLRRNAAGEVVGTSELPAVEALRIDQLLTSPHFGLHSTRDPEIDERFDEYYELLALRRPSALQRRRLDELVTELDTRQQLGSTRREQMLLAAIDEHLAREAEALAAGRGDALKEQTRSVLATILQREDAP